MHCSITVNPKTTIYIDFAAVVVNFETHRVSHFYFEIIRTWLQLLQTISGQM